MDHPTQHRAAWAGHEVHMMSAYSMGEWSGSPGGLRQLNHVPDFGHVDILELKTLRGSGR